MLKFGIINVTFTNFSSGKTSTKCDVKYLMNFASTFQSWLLLFSPQSFFLFCFPFPPFLRRERTSWRILKVTFDTNLLGTYLGRNDSAATVSNDSGCIIGVPWLGSNSSGYTFWLIIYNQSIAYKQDSLLMFFWVDVCFSKRVVRTLKNWRYGWFAFWKERMENENASMFCSICVTFVKG